MSWMAEEEVVFVHPDGRRVAGRIAIGTPAASGREGLHDFLQKGDRIVYGKDQAFPIEEYFAGLLVDPPRTVTR
jgi:hypothetical protein